MVLPSRLDIAEEKNQWTWRHVNKSYKKNLTEVQWTNTYVIEGERREERFRGKVERRFRKKYSKK